MKKEILIAIFGCLFFCFYGNSADVCYDSGIKNGNEMIVAEKITGIGIIIGFHQDEFIFEEALKFGIDKIVNRLPIEVKKVFSGSSAEKTGIRVKDRILAINGIPIEKIGAKEIILTDCLKVKMAEKLRRVEGEIFGHSGTSVVLRIKRVGCVDEGTDDYNSNGLSVGLLSIDFTVKREKIPVPAKIDEWILTNK